MKKSQKKQHELKVWNEEIVLQGLIIVKELLQELASQNQAYRLETACLLYTRYHDLQALRKEIVPNLTASDSQFDIIFESDIQRKGFLSYIRELAVWDIATKGEGPHRPWTK